MKKIRMRGQDDGDNTDRENIFVFMGRSVPDTASRRRKCGNITSDYSVDSNRNLFHNPYKISSDPSFSGDGKIVEQ